MSLITLLTKKAPKLGGSDSGPEVLEFDAVLEEELQSDVEITTYPIESGATPSDSIIILPKKYRIVGAISDNPISPSVTDFIGGTLSNFVDGKVAGPLIAGAAGLSAGLLGGPDGDRSTAALTKLLKIQSDRKPFTLESNDITLTNMVITNISRVRDPSNEGGLVFEANLQEMATLDTVLSVNATNPVSDTTKPESSQVIGDIDKGEVSTQTPQASTVALGDQI